MVELAIAMPRGFSRDLAHTPPRCAPATPDFVSEITLMDGRPGGRRRREDPPDHPVEPPWFNGKRAGHGGAHGDLDGDHDMVAQRLDDPAEAAQGDEPTATARVLRAVDGEQDLLEDGLDVQLAPGGRL